jgi:hypothetical protein
VTAGFSFDDEPTVNSNDEKAVVEPQRFYFGQGNGGGLPDSPALSSRR